MLKKPLDECSMRYKTIVDVDVHTAIIAIKGNPKFAEGAVVDAGVEASICEGGFDSENGKDLRCDQSHHPNVALINLHLI
ncbi:unnamed protein product [Arabidopsis thaliana]|uniref:Pectinesterase inhibitor domain-containing protein n=2 Tax=Arabidopsis TaxID=3701 RepID=A0A654F7Z7_ARATH|nr:unnamed protein product [Arabidopsis thaliana]